MASFVFDTLMNMNPSRRLVADWLRQYVELDDDPVPDETQLQVALWRGQLSVRNVALKSDAIYPLLNRPFVVNATSMMPSSTSSSATHHLHATATAGTSGAAASANTDVGTGDATSLLASPYPQSFVPNPPGNHHHSHYNSDDFVKSSDSSSSSSDYAYRPPPVRVTLVRSHVGQLDVHIPWKTLFLPFSVWKKNKTKKTTNRQHGTNPDKSRIARIHVRDLVLVLAVEAVEDTEERLRLLRHTKPPPPQHPDEEKEEEEEEEREQEPQPHDASRGHWGEFPGMSNDPTMTSSSSFSATSSSDYYHHHDHHIHAKTKEETTETEIEAETMIWLRNMRRDLKQARIREASHKLQHGRWSASWMAAARTYDHDNFVQQQQQRRNTLKQQQQGTKKTPMDRSSSRGNDHPSKKSGGWFSRFTQGWMGRLCAGLEVHVENLKILFVQDDMELGLMVPSIRLTNNYYNHHNNNPNHDNDKNEDTKKKNEKRQHEPNPAAAAAIATSTTTPPSTLSEIAAFYTGKRLSPSSDADDSTVHDDGDNDNHRNNDNDDSADEEIMNKRVQVLGLGVYIRRVATSTTTTTNRFQNQKTLDDDGETTTDTHTHTHDTEGRIPLTAAAAAAAVTATAMDADASARDFLLRPVDLSLDYSVVSSSSTSSSTSTTATPSSASDPHKKKRKQRHPQPPPRAARVVIAPTGNSSGSSRDHHHRDDQRTAATTETGADESSTIANDRARKRRRGKREKTTSSIEEEENVLEPKTTSSVASARLPKRASTVGTTPIPIPLHIRQQSNALLRPAALQRHSTLSSQHHHHRRTVTTESLPLVQPNNNNIGIISAYDAQAAARTAVNHHDDKYRASAADDRFESNIRVSAMELVWSSRTVTLVTALLSSAARTRNGRPKVSIQSELRKAEADAAAMMMIPIIHSSSPPLERSDHEEPRNRIFLQDSLDRKSQVIRFWWRYAFRMIVWELRERKRCRIAFQRRYLHFSWKNQQYKRKEYVELYISVHLNKSWNLLDPLRYSPVEELMVIEDEISIEQILLYRSIASAVFARGGRTLPESILGLSNALPATASSMLAGDEEMNEPRDKSMAPTKSSARSTTTKEIPSFVSLLEKQGEIARSRQCANHYDDLTAYDPIVTGTVTLFRRSDSVTRDDSTHAVTIDTNTVRGNNRNVVPPVPVSSGSKLERSATLLTFSITVEKLELLLIEEADLCNSQPPIVHADVESVESKMANQSDVSVLTDDRKFFTEGVEPRRVSESGTADDTPMLSTTDFLLYTAHTRVILRVTLSPLMGFVLARSGGGGARQVNVQVGNISATGVNSRQILTLGPSGRPAPVSEVNLIRSKSSISGTEWDRNAPEEAFIMSLIVNKIGNFLECDTSTIRFFFDVESFSNALKISQNMSKFPSRVLPYSPQAKTRVYLLKERVVHLKNLSCSIRFHGMEVILPIRHQSEHVSAKDDTGDFEIVEKPSIAFRLQMLEIYSGRTVSALCDELIVTPSALLRSDEHVFSDYGLRKTSRPTRSLQMIDLSDFTSRNSSIFSHHWVISASGIDCAMNFTPPTYYSWSKQNFLENAVNVEILWISNENSLEDLNRSKREICVRISPVELIASLGRIERIASVMPESPSKRDASGTGSATFAPRLEVLSQVLVNYVDLSVQRLRLSIHDELDHGSISIPEQARMQDILSNFLSVVESFDLSYPNEDALACAMQICIDRLIGKGFSLENSWEITNRALLTFLEECGANGANGGDMITAIDRAMSALPAQTIDVHEPPFDDPIPHYSFAFDVPKGVHLILADLYYDRCCSMVIPSVFLSDANGIHLLKIISHEYTVSNEEDEADVRHTTESNLRAQDLVAKKDMKQGGICLRSFHLDTLFSFGKGGETLSALGIDRICDIGSERSRQEILDIDFASIDLLFCRPMCETLVTKILNVFGPVLVKKSRSTKEGIKVGNDTDRNPGMFLDTTLMLSMRRSSLVIAADNLSPFLRLTVVNQFMRKSFSSKPLDCADSESILSVRMLSLVNLTSHGEMYPDIVSVLPESTHPALSGRSLKSSSFIQIRGVRVVLLMQHIREIQQFFMSGRYGFGLFLSSFRPTEKLNESTNKSSSESPVFEVHESSVLLPRSTISPDLVAVELRRVAMKFSRPELSFTMPSAKSRLFVSGNGNNRGRHSRLTLHLHGIRVFTSLPKLVADIGSAEQPILRFFYTIDGRAQPGKNVYCRRPQLAKTPMDVDDILVASLSRVWTEVTKYDTFLDVLIDRAPNFRLLVSHPLDSPHEGVELEIRLSQIALLFSIWYSNMQQLPHVFPFTATQLHAIARAPSIPADFPEYGTDEYKSFLLNTSNLTSEFGIVLKKLILRCIVDNSFFDFAIHANDNNAIRLEFKDVVAHAAIDSLSVTRFSSGASWISFVDESKTFESVIQSSAQHEHRDTVFSWADLHFGLSESYSSLLRTLPQSFQLSMFMTPGWLLCNIGMNDPQIVLTDLSSIICLLDFWTKFFSDPRLGNPSFTSKERVAALKYEIGKYRMLDEDLFSVIRDSVASSLDVRVWLHGSSLFIPCDTYDVTSPGVRIECDGLWYKYTLMTDFASHQVVSADLNLNFDEANVTKSDLLSKRKTNRLIDGLSFGLRFDLNEASKHVDVSFQMPFSDPTSCSLLSRLVSLQPIKADPVSVCQVNLDQDRSLGPRVCEFNVIIEVIPLISKLMLNLTSSEKTVEAESPLQEKSTVKIEDNGKTISLALSLKDIRVFSCDPVLGTHLPVAVLSLAGLDITLSQFKIGSDAATGIQGDQSLLGDLHFMSRVRFWADYFKLGLTRSWEPLVEAYQFDAFYEKSHIRGEGWSIMSDSIFHLNVSGALLVIIDEVVDSYRRTLARAFGLSYFTSSISFSRDLNSRKDYQVMDTTNDYAVFHEIPRMIESHERIAFSVRNMTGQEIRFSKPIAKVNQLDSESDLMVSYLDHEKSAQLNFSPSISIVSNMSIIEVEFPGMPNGKRSFENPKTIASNAIDFQIPGFLWMQGIKVGSFGRSFADIVPSTQVVLSKAKRDWRIANAMKVVVEVGLQNGGRQVTLRSIFSVTNRTAHTVHILFHPDPQYHLQTMQRQIDSPDKEGDAVIEPGGTHQVPVLLSETALRKSGSHLGSIWIRPSLSVFENPSLFATFAEDKESITNEALRADNCTMPIQLAKLVSDSALLFNVQQKNEIVEGDTKTGIHLSCPLTHKSTRLAPFSYVIEISRSPLVKASPSFIQDGSTSQSRSRIHGPVYYSLSIHPSFVFVNLLPKGGRFELVHAVRQTLLWSADLKPGEHVSIHSVGLDSPLLLYLNIGFCKTPTGEGALVHHGIDQPRGSRDPLVFKAIGKAGKAVTKKLGSTLTKLSESPDRRGHKRLFMVQNPAFLTPDRQGPDQAVTHQSKSDLGLNADVNTAGARGKTVRVDNAVFFPNDVAIETTVVDGIGQRLTLNIENVRGGGGQRRISVYAPFWIVNTTEHALRYRQEKTSKVFVSGTVSSLERNGSVLLDGGRAETNHDSSEFFNPHRTTHLYEKNIFSGMPGALASSPGRCNLNPDEVLTLVNEDLSLDKLYNLAFMFNFKDGLLSLGNQKLCIQLWDGTEATTYKSDWSQGLSLDSIGISQIVAMHCKDGRSLELTVIVTLAPDLLSGYTKIIRILPRFFVVNALPYPVRLWQDSSIFRPPGSENTAGLSDNQKWRIARRNSTQDMQVNQYDLLWGKEALIDERAMGVILGGTRAHPSALYVASITQSGVIPFSLPDPRGERQLRIDIGENWNLSASISADCLGEHTVKVTSALDLRLTSHISTRASPEYTIEISPRFISEFGSELGIWFESEWGNDKNLIVKSVKKDSFAFKETEVRIGDELLAIDGESVSNLSFSTSMDKLKSRIAKLSGTEDRNDIGIVRFRQSSIRRGVSVARRPNAITPPCTTAQPLVLRFRTVEERLRRVRLKAARVNDMRTLGCTILDVESNEIDKNSEHRSIYLKLDVRSVQNCTLLVVKEQNLIPYEIHNRSIGSTIYFRQRGCDGHPWQSLKPGHSEAYTWEEPLKAKKLVVRVALQSTHEADGLTENSTQMNRGNCMFGNIEDEDDSIFAPPCTVPIEEIGYQDRIPCQALRDDDDSHTRRKFLELEVEVNGMTRVLAVQDSSTVNAITQLEQHLTSLKSKQDEEALRLHALRGIRISKDLSQIPSLINAFSGEPIITQCHQIIVEVIEANGLSTDAFTSSCNPYAQVYLKQLRVKLLSRFKNNENRATYYIKNTVSPTWKNQIFVFTAPRNAVSETRGYSLTVRLRDYRKIGSHKILGTARIELNSIRDQRSLVGWFPLAGKTGRQELDNPLSHWGRGSVKLRLQWVYTQDALLDYFILLSEGRISDLNGSVEGISVHLRIKREAEVKRIESVDGYQRVRIRDVLNIPSRVKESRLPVHAPTSLWASRRTSVRSSHFTSEESPAIAASASVGEILLDRQYTTNFYTPTRVPIAILKAKVRIIESLIQQSRLSSDSREPRGASGLHEDNPSIIHASSIQTLSFACALFRDPQLVIKVEDESIRIRIDDNLLKRLKAQEKQEDSSSNLSRIFDKFQSASISLPKMKNDLNSSARAYLESRNAFERAALRKIQSVTHPGGVLIIRPVTALNLPDGYTGMFVRVRFGTDSYVTQTVDARISPSWLNLDQAKQMGSVASQRRRKLEAAVSPESGPNDLNIRIPAQKTNGLIVLSVFGERRHANIHTKTELGVLHLPLGSSIAACIDSAKEIRSDNGNCYLRWFPLENPALVGYNDWSHRPVDGEKHVDTEFQDYFAPCIKLSLMWLPEVENYLDQDNGSRRKSHSLQNASLPLYSLGNYRVNASTVMNYFTADVGRLSIALIASERAFELVSMTVFDIEARYWTTKAKTRIGVSVGWLQIDHQQEDSREPVILCPTPTEFTWPVIQILAVRDNTRSISEIVSFDFIDASFEEFDLTLEERIVIDLFDFFNSVNLRRHLRVRRTTSQPLSECRDAVDTPSQSKKSLTKSDKSTTSQAKLQTLFFGNEISSGDRKVYIEQLYLGVVKVNLSYLKGKRQSWQLTTEGWVDKGGNGVSPYRVGLRDFTRGDGFFNNMSLFFHERSEAMMKWSQSTSDEDREAGSTGYITQSLPQRLAALFPNVSDAPIRMQGKALNHVLESPYEIIQSIQKYYVNETLRQVYRIIGSLDFVGNPTMLFTSFFSGFRDLVLTPSKAFMKSPTNASGVGVGVAQGSLSLLSHSFSGFFGSWAKISAWAGQSLTWFTLDPEYRNWHRDNIVVEASFLNRVWKRRGVQSVKDTVARPVVDIAIGIGGALVGIVAQPMKGYQRGGGSGLLLGVASAGTGLVVKPIVGVLDAMSHFSASIYDIAKSVNLLEKRLQPAVRLRLPYTFGIMRILSPFDPISAQAVSLLRQFPMRRSVQVTSLIRDTLVHVERLSNVTSDTYIIVTSCRIVLARIRRDASGRCFPSLDWEVNLVGKSKVSLRIAEHGHSGFALTVTVSTPREDNIADAESMTLGDADTIGLKPKQVVAFDLDDDSVNDCGSIGCPSPIGSNVEDDSNLEMQFQGTSRGEKGELLEWFTILGEYHHRPQLTRIHNAISCVTGNISLVVKDMSVGPSWSTEGFTSFGMFYFHQQERLENTDEDERRLRVLQTLDYLPWLDRISLEELQVLDSDEHALYLQNFHKACSQYREMYEKSQRLGGPQWLVMARAKATLIDQSIGSSLGSCNSVVTFDDEYLPVNEDDSYSISRPGMVRRWVSHPVLPIPDGRVLDALPKKMPFQKDRLCKSVDCIPSTSECETSTALTTIHQSSNVPDSDEDVFASFQTAIQPSSDVGTSLATFLPLTKLNKESFPFGPEDLQRARRRLRPSMLPRRSFSESSTDSEAPEVNVKEKDKSSPPSSRISEPGVDRMDRMERLMERLLIFSGEQVIQQRPPVMMIQREQQPTISNADDSTIGFSFHAEMSRLKAELEALSHRDEASQQELKQLRLEVESLQKMLSSTSRSQVETKDQASSHDMDSTDLVQSLSLSNNDRSLTRNKRAQLLDPLNSERSHPVFFSSRSDLPSSDEEEDSAHIAAAQAQASRSVSVKQPETEERVSRIFNRVRRLAHRHTPSV